MHPIEIEVFQFGALRNDEFVASLKKMDGLYAIFYDQKALEEHSKQTVKTDELRASVRASLTLVNERIQNLDAPKDEE